MTVKWSDGGSGAVNVVHTTGIYCRAGCAGRPNPANTARLRSPAEAEAAGFRPCLRCRPDRLPLVTRSAATDPVVARALILICDGFLDGHAEDDLGREVGVSARHLRRLFADAVGATPSQVATGRRAHFARALLDETDLTVTEIAFAAGFSSLRSMNEVVRSTFRASPTELRRKRRRRDASSIDGGLRLTLRAHRPLDGDAVLHRLADRAIEGVESVRDGVYRRATTVCGHPGVIEVEPVDAHTIGVVAHLPAVTGLIDEVARVRRLLCLDELGVTPPGPWSTFEREVRELADEVLGRRAGAELADLARRYGTPVDGAGHVTRVFPTPAQLGAVRPDDGPFHRALLERCVPSVDA